VSNGKAGGTSPDSLGMLAPPILCYVAPKDVHVVVFHGPEEAKVHKIWSPDNGKTKYALVLADTGDNMDNFAFSGNGLAIVSFEDVPFTVLLLHINHKNENCLGVYFRSVGGCCPYNVFTFLLSCFA
jgi:hypothetical protein